MVQIDVYNFNYVYTLFMFLITIFGRFMGIFILPCILTIFRKNYTIHIKELVIIWYSGLIKGYLLII